MNNKKYEKLEVINLNWVRQRGNINPGMVRKMLTEDDIESIELINFEFDKLKPCKMLVTFKEGKEIELHGQVGRNEILNYWWVNGLGLNLNQVAVKVFPKNT